MQYSRGEERHTTPPPLHSGSTERLTMKLFFNQTENAGPCFPVRWCLCPADREKLTQDDAKFPCMLFIVTKDGQEQSRDIVPLTQELHFLTLPAYGDLVIHAYILYDYRDNDKKSKSARALREYVLNTYSSGGYRHRLIDPDGNGLHREVRYESSIEIIASETTNVHAARNLFAPEPPLWEKRLLDSFFNEPAKNQCEHRKRRCIFYPLTPITIPLFLLFLSIVTFRKFLYALLSTIGGKRSVHWSAVINPTLWSANHIWDQYGDTDSCFYLTKEDGSPRRWVAWIQPLLDRWQQSAEKKKEKELKFEKEQRLKELYRLTCTRETSREPSINSLPPQKQTVYLRVMDFKQKVCKPFAQ